MGKKSRRNRTTTKDERKAHKKKTVENINKRYMSLGYMQQLLDMQAKYGGLDAWQRTMMNQIGVARQKDATNMSEMRRHCVTVCEKAHATVAGYACQERACAAAQGLL